MDLAIRLPCRSNERKFHADEVGSLICSKFCHLAIYHRYTQVLSCVLLSASKIKRLAILHLAPTFTSTFLCLFVLITSREVLFSRERYSMQLDISRVEYLWLTELERNNIMCCFVKSDIPTLMRIGGRLN